ncbi:MAG TPA: hypothetical protein VMV27_02705 [Candidatus Binataceae bacterium]|nr:hypothetical protein [Candidatus Binataceae bacterium]
MRSGATIVTLSMLIGLAFLAPTSRALAQDSGASTAASLKEIQREMRQMRAERKRDRALIQHLETQVNELETHQTKAQATTEQLQHTDQQLQAATVELKHTSEQVKSLQAKVAAPASPADFAQSFQRYLGSHSFTITGAAAGQFVYDQQNSSIAGLHHATQNTFLFDWEPMILYRPTDWILFEGVFSAAFGNTGTGTDLSTADFQIFLNKYMTLVAGLYDQPFGDWYESQSPMWVNRFITAPLPFGNEAVVPPSEIGLQLRGGMQWGKLGQDWDYTIWGGNGPNYSQPVLGAALGGPSSIASSQTNGKSIGGRLRIYPLPLEAELGRLELGASTYNGKWANGNWFNSWGVDFNYFKDAFQARGEWLESYRQMPGGLGTDHRQGWYLQAGYFLNRINAPLVPNYVNDYLHRLEPLVRFSGVNQRAVAADDITGATGVGFGGTQVGLVPDFGMSGSPALYAPHSREVALGLDYYIAPSIVWQNEFDIEMPESGGLLVSSTGATSPIGAIPNDRAFLSQFTIGF